MSDRIDFFEVRTGFEHDWESVCLCKTEDDAQKIMEMLKKYTEGDYFIQHVEIVANVDLEIGDW